MIFFVSSVIFVFGLIVGSFLNVCIYRIPSGMSIAKPRSHCPACKHTLGALDLFPVFSWLFVGGRCRYCGVRIPVRYMLIELLTGGLFLLCFLRFGITWPLLSALVLASILVVVTFIDIDHTIIPDELVIFGMIVAVVFVLFSVVPGYHSGYWGNALDALLGMLSGALPLILIDLLARWILKRDGMGGGDMKLMAMVGLFLGWRMTLLALLLAVYLGGLVGIVLLIRRRRRNVPDDAQEESSSAKGTTMPFGPFLALGSMVSLLYGSDLIAWYLNTLL